MARAKRTKKVERINLGNYSLDINPRKTSYEKFDYREIDEYMHAVAGTRDYQYDAIKNVMTYLWGGSYKNAAELARENFDQKPHLREKYGNVEILINHMPLSDRLSGVVNMATGTGKSYVIYAVAYLSLIMGYVDRVLVLGPSSTIIEKGLNEKFRKFMADPAYLRSLPVSLRGKAVDLLNDTDYITNGSITIENVNAIYSFGGIIDSMKSDDAEWLVLSDEVHHAYSHLKFDENKLVLDKDVAKSNKKRSSDDQERLWMKFLRENKQITRHIGFTGTPYNGNDYFADVIYNYSLKTAIEQRYVKEINPIINTDSEDGDDIKWTDDKRFDVIFQEHEKIKIKYGYPGHDNVPVPRSYPADEKNIEALLALENKIWLRAKKGAGSKAALPVTSLLQVQGWLDYWKQKDNINPSDFMISEFLPGKEYAYQSLWYRGKLISDQARERVQYLAGNLSVTGQTSSPSVARTVSRDDVYENGEAAVRAVTYNNPHGVFCVDMKENTQGIPCITEINAGRFFTTSNFFAHAGLNMPAMYLDLALTGKTKRNTERLPDDLYWLRIVDMGYKLVDGSKW